MLTTIHEHYSLAVTAIALAGLLLTTNAGANPTTYRVQEPRQGADGVLSGASAAYFTRLTEGFSSSYGDRVYSFLRANTAAVLKSAAAPTASDHDKLTSTAVRLFPRKSLIDLTPLRTAVISLTRAVPQPAALILVGAGLLGLAFAIRRITARKDPYNESESEERGFNINTRAEVTYPEAEIADLAVPLFDKNAAGGKDPISLSQPS